jgi:hypothetical protein
MMTSTSEALRAPLQVKVRPSGKLGVTVLVSRRPVPLIVGFSSGKSHLRGLRLDRFGQREGWSSVAQQLPASELGEREGQSTKGTRADRRPAMS